MWPTSCSDPPTCVRMSSPSIGVRLDQGALLGRERLRLLDDGLRDADLADVVQERGELGLRALRRGQLQHLCDPRDQLDDAAAVAAGVLVVGFDDVAEKQHRAPVGHVQLLLLLEPLAPLAGEDRKQHGDREQQQERVAHPDRGERREQAERREREVDAVGDGRHRDEPPQRDAERAPLPHQGACQVGAELGREGGDVHRPVAPARGALAPDEQHEHRAEHVPARAQEHDDALAMAAAADDVGVQRHPVAGGDRQRHPSQRAAGRASARR